MTAGKQAQTSQVPAGLAGPGGFPWSRLVIGVVALVVSATVSWRAGRPALEPARSKAPAVAAGPANDAPAAPQAIPDLPPQLPLPPQAPPLAQDQPIQVGHSPQVKPVVVVGSATVPAAAQLQRTSTHVKPQARRHPRAKTSQGASSATQAPRAKLVRSGADPQREYLASREEVAALTGEDSGSAYLSQLAARRHAPAAKPVVHAQAGAHGRRSTPRRS